MEFVENNGVCDQHKKTLHFQNIVIPERLDKIENPQ